MHYFAHSDTDADADTHTDPDTDTGSDTGNPEGYSAAELAAAMGIGANIGNTLENTTTWETGWGQPLISFLVELSDYLKRIGRPVLRLSLISEGYAEAHVKGCRRRGHLLQGQGFFDSAIHRIFSPIESRRPPLYGHFVDLPPP